MKKEDIIIQDKYSDLKVKILENGWVSIIVDDGDVEISLGNYPNKRFEILEEMFRKLKEKKSSGNKPNNVWECRNCGVIIWDLIKPSKCSCGNKHSYYLNSQVSDLVRRRIQQEVLDIIDDCQDTIRKFMMDRYARTDMACWLELELLNNKINKLK